MPEDIFTDNVLRKQALDAALSYAAILGPIKDRTASSPFAVVEIADTFYKFLAGEPQNV